MAYVAGAKARVDGRLVVGDAVISQCVAQAGV